MAARRLGLQALHVPRKLANRLALLSALQLVLVGGSLSVLSFALGRRSGLEISETYRQNASVVELSTRLSRKLNHPLWINTLNLAWLEQNPGRVRDYAAMAERFWNQMRAFPVDYINFGGSDGSFIGMERGEDGALLLNEDTSRTGRGSMAVYAMKNGKPGALLERIPGMTETHEEAWYTDTAKAGRPLWSSIYAWEDQPEIFSISYNAPLFGANRTLRGVVGVDMVLSQLSTWLEQVWEGRDGLALIVEPDGTLVASSKPGQTLTQRDGTVQRSRLVAMADPMAKALHQRLKGGANGKPERTQIEGHPYSLVATPWGADEGLNWILLTSLTVEPGTAAADQTALFSLLASGAALAGAAALTNRQIRSLLQPLRQLEGTSEELSQKLKTATQRLQPEALQFNSGVTEQSGAELVSLDGALRELVDGYNRLTSELREREASLAEARERERFRDAQTLALLKDKLRSSLQAAAVAHEINQPLSVLLLNSQLLIKQADNVDLSALPSGWRQQLEGIRHEADRVVLTIEKMRALLRNVQTEHQRLNLREICQSALLYARSGGSSARVAIDSTALENEDSPAWIEGDAVQIQIAIVNLLRNAAEALLEAQTSRPWIGLSLRAEADQWCLEVADNGPGLPQSLLDQLPLQTSKASGSGLGLFVVQTTMENHHGQLDVAVSAEGGALLRLRFPALPSSGD